MQAESYQRLAECCEEKARLTRKLMAKPSAEEPEGYP